MIDGHAADRVALISRNRETTYGELRDQVARVRGGLAARGVVDGDRVVVICANNLCFVISYFAIVGLGAVAVPLNPESPAAELEREIAEVTPVAVIIGPSVTNAWAEIDARTREAIATVVCAEGETDGHDATHRVARVRADRCRRRRSRPSRGDDVHERHRRSTASGDAQPREPARQHRTEPERARRDPPRRRRVRRVAVVPHLRTHGRARRVVHGRRHRVAGAAVRSGDDGRVDRAAPGHDRARGAHDVGRFRVLR